MPRYRTPRLTPADRARFWTKVTIPGDLHDCWLWATDYGPFGYGQFWAGGALHPAHRVSWFLHHGPRSLASRLVLHRCDVPRCVNPLHLYLGDHKQNTRDMVGRGRHVTPLVPGHTIRGRNDHPFPKGNQLWRLRR